MSKYEKEIADVVSGWLDDYDLESLFEHFDLSPVEVFEIVYNAGEIDEDLLSDFIWDGLPVEEDEDE